MSDSYDCVMRGKLCLKGGLQNKSKRKRSTADTAEQQPASAAVSSAPKPSVGDHLTPAEKRFRERHREREAEVLRRVVQKSHRQRVEEFNTYLSKLTEHNDIPRISAAGNG